MKKGLVSLLVLMSIILISNIGLCNSSDIQDKVYSNWAPVNTDYVKYHLNSSNTIIEDVESSNDLVSVVDVKIQDSNGSWYKAVLYIYKAASSTNLYMKFQRNDMYDESNTRYVKVNWE